jgi:hypothetical protein
MITVLSFNREQVRIGSRLGVAIYQLFNLHDEFQLKKHNYQEGLLDA